MHALDNVIWQALTTRDAQFAESFDEARRFVREVGPLGAFREHGPQGYASLAGLVGPEGTIGLFLDDPYDARAGWNFVAGAPLLQMVADNGITPPVRRDSGAELIIPEIVELGPQDSKEMIELTALTKPGPFGNRTHELGTYLGIRWKEKLVAMAGERMRFPGFTEISAVCTHPDHRHRGYSSGLVHALIRGILDRGDTPFLHIYSDNSAAGSLYEHLGFSHRRTLTVTVLKRQD